MAILALVAVRVLQMRLALEWQPEASAEQVASAAEVDVLCAYQQQPRRKLSVREFVRGVAKLGGFLGRKHDGEPGVRTLWRGYQRLQDLLIGYHLRSSPTSKRRRHIGNR